MLIKRCYGLSLSCFSNAFFSQICLLHKYSMPWVIWKHSCTKMIEHNPKVHANHFWFYWIQFAISCLKLKGVVSNREATPIQKLIFTFRKNNSQPNFYLSSFKHLKRFEICIFVNAENELHIPFQSHWTLLIYIKRQECMVVFP